MQILSFHRENFVMFVIFDETQISLHLHSQFEELIYILSYQN